MNEEDRLLRIIKTGESSEQEACADDIAASWVSSRKTVICVLADESVRRWSRAFLLQRLTPEQSAQLAERLLRWPDDFRIERRDRSTANVVAVLSEDQIHRHLLELSGSNCALALWERIAQHGSEAVMSASTEVFRSGTALARETTLHLLVLDPYGPGYLSNEQQDKLLVWALDDADAEIRGLAAEVIAAEKSEVLLERWEEAPRDESERVRMAFWRAALAYRPDDALEAAGALALDWSKPHEARRTALLALGENTPTRSIATLLSTILSGEDEVLAEDAAQLMWRYHRAPDIANAASESKFESVRDLGNRLLHPEMGSPAAGGSRPGDPTRTTDIFRQIQDGENPERYRPGFTPGNVGSGG
jgi:hypothetical protein